MSAAGGERARVKICGVTRPEDAVTAVELGADFLGLNFWAESARQIDLAAAVEIAAAVAGRTGLVGVFVNEERTRIRELMERVGLDLVQLHGDESPSEVGAFGSKALKAIRFTNRVEAEALAEFPRVWGFLVEARRVGAYGGIGKGWDYSAVASLAGGLEGRPLLIAGGLRPENVGEAIRASRAWGVDVASGVESSPGRKDRDKLERFFLEVRNASVQS